MTTRRFHRALWGVFALLALTGLLKHHTFHYGVYDLGIFHQVLWNTSRLRWFASSLKQMSYLGDHFSPALALLAPLEWLPFPVEALVIAQAAALAATAWCVHALAREQLGDERLAALLGLATAIHPALYAPVAWDFHPEPFMAAALAAGLLALSRGQRGRTALWLLVVLAGKEDAGLLTLGLGVVLAADRRTRGFGLALAALSVAWVALAMLVWMPHFRPPTAPGDWFYLQRYAHLGDTLGAIVRFAIFHPFASLARSLTPWKALTLLVLIAGFAGAPLRSWRLAAIVPAAAEHLLSARASQLDFQFQYIAPLVPLLAWAAIGAAPSTLARRPRLATAVVLLIGLGAGVVPRLWLPWFWPRPQHAGLRDAVRVVSALPADAPVCAQMRFGAWLAARRDFTLCVRWELERAQYEHFGWPPLSSAPYQVFDTHDDDGAPGLVARAHALVAAGAVVLSDRDGVLVLKVDAAVLQRAAGSSTTTSGTTPNN